MECGCIAGKIKINILICLFLLLSNIGFSDINVCIRYSVYNSYCIQY